MLFFLTRPPPPRSTLFPYTTLFRSSYVIERVHFDPKREQLYRDGKLYPVPLDFEYRDGTPVVTDRKSTRLNSSHLGISYAVFCLKKKKQTTQGDGAGVRRA